MQPGAAVDAELPVVPPTFGPDDVDGNPLRQFGRWLADARASGEAEPEAVSLATSDVEGRPSVRFVLLRGVDDDAFVFFTNRTSRKARELAANPAAAMAWRWARMDRQIRASGRVEMAADEVSDAYFASRPRGSQLGAWASEQSTVIDDRDVLERRVAAVEARFAGRPVSRPPFWGGYRLVPDTVEVWQGRTDRLHDRVRYRSRGPDWIVDRLSP